MFNDIIELFSIPNLLHLPSNFPSITLYIPTIVFVDLLRNMNTSFVIETIKFLVPLIKVIKSPKLVMKSDLHITEDRIIQILHIIEVNLISYETILTFFNKQKENSKYDKFINSNLGRYFVMTMNNHVIEAIINLNGILFPTENEISIDQWLRAKGTTYRELQNKIPKIRKLYKKHHFIEIRNKIVAHKDSHLNFDPISHIIIPINSLIASELKSIFEELQKEIFECFGDHAINNPLINSIYGLKEILYKCDGWDQESEDFVNEF